MPKTELRCFLFGVHDTYPFLSSFSSSAKRPREEPRNAASIPRFVILAHMAFSDVFKKPKHPLFSICSICSIATHAPLWRAKRHTDLHGDVDKRFCSRCFRAWGSEKTLGKSARVPPYVLRFHAPTTLSNGSKSSPQGHGAKQQVVSCFRPPKEDFRSDQI